MVKKIFKFVLALITILGVAILLLLWNINPIIERLKPQLTKVLSDAVGKPVSFESLELSLFPNVGIELQKVGLEGSSNETASVGSVILESSLLGLLKGDVSVSQLIISDAAVNITRAKNGEISVGGISLTKKPQNNTSQTKKPRPAKNNNSPAVPPGKTKTKTETVPKTPDTPTDTSVQVVSEGPDGPKEESAKVSFQLQDAQVKNLSITFKDEVPTTPTTIKLSNFNAELANIGKDSEGSIDLTASLLGTQENNLMLKGSINPSKSLGPIPMTDVKLSLKYLDLARVSTLLESYGVNQPKLKIGNNLNISIGLKVDSKGIQLTPNVDAKNAMIAFGDVFSKAQGTDLSIDAEAQPSLLGALFAKRVDLTLGENKISLPLTHMPATGTTLEVKTSEFSLAGLGAFLPAIGQHAVSGNLATQLKIELPGKTPGKANTKIPPINGTLNLSSFSAKLGSEANAKKISNSDIALNFKGNALKIAPSKLNIAEIPMVLSGNVTNFTAPDFALLLEAFKGTIKLNGSLSPSSVLNLTTLGKALSLDEISKVALATSRITLKGTLQSLQSTISTNTKNPSAINGNAAITAVDGSIAGFNIVKAALAKVGNIPGLQNALLQYIPEKHRDLVDRDSTEFNELLLQVQLAAANTTIKKFSLKHEKYLITGTGNISKAGAIKINAQLRLTPVVTEDMILKEPRLKLLEDREGNIAFPIMIIKDGKVPVVTPDVSHLVQSAVKNTAKEAGKKALDKISPGLGGALDSLFK